MPKEEKKQEVKEEAKQEEPRYTVKEVATQTDLVIVDTEDDSQYNLFSAMVKVMNDLEDLKQGLL